MKPPVSRWCLAAVVLASGAAGATAVLALQADATTRWWSAAFLLAALAVGLAGSLAVGIGRLRVAGAPPLAEPAWPPSAQADARDRLAALQAQVEHLPVAAWLLAQGRLQPWSARARRLMAPGGVRDPAALQAWLCQTTESGGVLLDTERGSERWQLRRQALAVAGQAQALLVLVPLESELEQASLQAWQQLVQVLTHEIMNSLTPIQSLAQTAVAMLDDAALAGPADAAAPPVDGPGAASMRLALDAIQRRAGALSSFITTYRRVSQWPAPQMAPTDLGALFARLQQAVGPAWQARGGTVHFDMAVPGQRLMADEGQLEQALLALLRNAEQATASTPAPRLWVQARTTRGGRLQLSVRDNGPGVAAGLERQIFLPFFSTREGGQGIGLAVVRRLVHGMGGRVRHVRPLEGGACFVLSF